jgi:CRISPR system Cascade subunit CasA
MGNKSAIQWPLRWGCTCSHSGKHAKPAGVLGYAHRLLGALGQADSWLPVMVLGLTSDQAKLVRWRVDNVALPTCLLEQEDVVELLRAALRDSEALFVGLRQIATSMLAESMPDPKHKDTRARARAMFDNGASAATYFAHLDAIAPAWQAACRQLGEGARAIRACAQHEPRYLGLIKPLLPPVTKEATHV